MLFVKTCVKPSKIHGLGLFAAERITKGTIVWRFVVGLDRVWTSKELSEIKSDVFRDFIKKYAFKEKLHDSYILGIDDDRFQNHSSNPNIGEDPKDKFFVVTKQIIALRDIEEGEELLSNYNDWDEEAKSKEIPV